MYQALSLTTSPVSIPNSGDARHATIIIEGGDVRFLVDGVPSSTNGNLLPSGSTLVLNKRSDVKNIQLVAVTTATAHVNLEAVYDVAGSGSGTTSPSTSPTDTTGTQDAVAPAKFVMTGGYAETGTPTAVADGDAVRNWLGKYGELVILGADVANGLLKMQEQYPDGEQTLDRYTTPLLDAVTATGASGPANVSLYNKVTYYVVASGVTLGAVVELQASPDGTNYVTFATITVVADGTTRYAVSDEKDVKIRANITTWQDGTYTVSAIGGR